LEGVASQYVYAGGGEGRRGETNEGSVNAEVGAKPLRLIRRSDRSGSKTINLTAGKIARGSKEKAESRKGAKAGRDSRS